jgi:hypothetical protein
MARTGVSLRKPVKLEELENTFQEIFHRQQSYTLNLAATLPMLRDFFSVPAMSAGLYPGLDYPDRFQKVQRLMDHLPQATHAFRWILKLGRSTGTPSRLTFA